MGAGCEPGVALRAGAGGEGAAVELALEGRAALGGREGEARVGVVVRIGRRRGDAGSS